jgi:hypothetical protein
MYTASDVNFYNATVSLTRFEYKNIAFCLEKRSSLLQRWRCGRTRKSRRIGSSKKTKKAILKRAILVKKLSRCWSCSRPTPSTRRLFADFFYLSNFCFVRLPFVAVHFNIILKVFFHLSSAFSLFQKFLFYLGRDQRLYFPFHDIGKQCMHTKQQFTTAWLYLAAS